MTLITVERIKLFSTRSPWWCMIVAAVLSIGLAALATGFASGPEEAQVTPAMTQFGVGLGQMVIMVMAALAVTTEYRFGTIRTSFQAVPQRMALLLNKTIVVATLAAVVGLVSAEWRLMFGQGLVYGIAAIFAIAVGILIRQSAGAIAILILWPLLVESLLPLIPKIGDDLQKWTPFTNANQFLNGGQDMGLAGADAAGATTALALVGAPVLRRLGSGAAGDRPVLREQARRLTNGRRVASSPAVRGPAGLRGPGRSGPWSIRLRPDAPRAVLVPESRTSRRLGGGQRSDRLASVHDRLGAGLRRRLRRTVRPTAGRAPRGAVRDAALA
jgi:ABC-2 type transport system permease protein